MEVLDLGEKCREQEEQEGLHAIRDGKVGAGNGSRPRARARWRCGSGEESGILTSELEASGSGYAVQRDPEADPGQTKD